MSSGSGGQVRGLDGLRDRLRGGVGAAAQGSRPADHEKHDSAALAVPWPDHVRNVLDHIRDVPWADPEGPEKAIAELTTMLASHRRLLLAVVLAPDKIITELGKRCGSDAQGIIDTWVGLLWVAEAAWIVISRPSTGPGTSDRDHELLLPLAARLRFLVLSEPMRARGHADAWWVWPPDSVFDGGGVLNRALGTGSWHLVTAACQESRREWLACLDQYQSHYYLAAARPAQVEEELRWVLFRAAEDLVPLGVSTAPLTEAAPLTSQDRAVLADATEKHLLPRFDLTSVIRLAATDGEMSPWRRARVWIAILAVGAGLAAVGCAADLLVRQATWLAVGCYLLIGTGAVMFGPAWAALWLLRLPAASSVAVIALVSFLPGGWLTAPPGGWAAVAALLLAATGYLMTEARNHGVERRALLRPLAVAAVALVHALLVSLIGLVAVAPAFVGNGAQFAALWARPDYRHAGMVLLLASAWCLAVGVFSQILWDDRPITAPLAHVSWRSGQ